MVDLWQPIRPIEVPLIINKVVLERFKGKSVLFDSKKSLPSGLIQTERQASAPCEKINNRIFAILGHSTSLYKIGCKVTKNNLHVQEKIRDF